MDCFSYKQIIRSSYWNPYYEIGHFKKQNQDTKKDNLNKKIGKYKLMFLGCFPVFFSSWTLFQTPSATFGPIGGHFGFFSRCGVAGSKRVPPAPLVATSCHIRRCQSTARTPNDWTLDGVWGLFLIQTFLKKRTPFCF